MLTKASIIEAAAEVADVGGVTAVTMRNVAKQLGVEAMSLYYHLKNKEELLDGLSEWVFDQIQLPNLEQHWREAMFVRAHSARAVLSAHPWSLGMLESRPTPGKSLLRHHDLVLGCLMASGMSPRLAGHAFSAIDSYIFGFVLTEVSAWSGDDIAESGFVREVFSQMDSYPNIALVAGDAMSQEQSSIANEFDFGLNLILDAFERLREESDIGAKASD